MDTWQLIPATAFSEYANEWDKLNQQLYQSHPMLDSRFIGALLKHFGDDQIYLAHYPSSIEQSSNMLLLRQRTLGVWSTFLPSQAQIAPVLCSSPKKLETLFRTLPGFVFFLDLLAQDPLYSFNSYLLPITDKLHHATININTRGTFEDFWQNRSKNLRKTVKTFLIV